MTVINKNGITWISNGEIASAENANRPLNQVIDQVNDFFSPENTTFVKKIYVDDTFLSKGLAAGQGRSNGENDLRFWQKTDILNIGATQETARSSLGLGTSAFTNIVADTGSNTNATMHQRAITEAVNAVDDKANKPGFMVLFAGDIVPPGYLLCDGRAVSRTTYSNLFSVIGTKFGTGNNTTTFGLPDVNYNLISYIIKT